MQQWRPQLSAIAHHSRFSSIRFGSIRIDSHTPARTLLPFNFPLCFLKVCVGLPKHTTENAEDAEDAEDTEGTEDTKVE